MKSENNIRVFTWHIHGSYLYYLSQANITIFIPVDDQRSEGYVGRGSTFPFGPNVVEVPAVQVRELEVDCIIFQTNRNYLVDQHCILTPKQRTLPRIYLEHDPPQQVPTDTRHVVNDPNVTIVHVTDFNRLMWDNGTNPALVIDHGIHIKPVRFEGSIKKGIVVINNIHERGRRLGLDIFNEVREQVPLDIIGMNTEKVGGLGEVLHPDLPDFIKQYRFFFNPIRYTSLGLAVLEAMMVGMPVVALATTELVTVIRDGVSGFIHTNINQLIDRMKLLLQDHDIAIQLGAAGHKVAVLRFNIDRFKADWEILLRRIVSQPNAPTPHAASIRI